MPSRPPRPRPSPPAPQDPYDSQDKTHLVTAVILARFLTRYGVLNTTLEDFLEGQFPETLRGDYSDVVVVTPTGKIPWNGLRRLSESELGQVMKEVEVQLSRCLEIILQHQQAGELETLLKRLEGELFGTNGVRWDRPH